MLFTLKLPPGVYKNGTDYQSKGRYKDSNLVRWFEGTLRPVGGWRQVIGGVPRTPLQVSGKARGMFAWRDNGTERYLAIGTHTKLYARQGTVNALADITPVGLVTGFPDSGANTGYGGGPYGYDTYGTPRTTADLSQIATTWSFDNFGQILLAVQSQDGKLYSWSLNTLSPATQVIATSGTVPLNNKGVIVTDERFVMLLQAGGNRRLVQWSDQEDLFNWQITATTQAGSFELQTNGEIIAAKRVRGQTLILTSTDAHVANYIGPPLVYGFERVGTGCGCISRNGLVVVDKAAVWMGENAFYMYDGFVKPIPCDVSDYVFTRLNIAQKAKVWGVHNSEFGEVTFFYPASTNIDSYVTYNYRENHWSVGSLARSIGIDAEVYTNPLRVDTNGYVYEHEVGFNYDGAMPYAETGPLELGEGDQVYMTRYIYPDEKTQGAVQASFATKFYPNGNQYDYGPYYMGAPTSVRFTGRQVAVKIESLDLTQYFLANPVDFLVVDENETLLSVGTQPQGMNMNDWRVGNFRLEIEQGGLR